MKVAVIGTGRVGGVIAPNIGQAGHDVVFGVRDPADPKYAAAGQGVPLTAMAYAGAWADVIILAINWDAVDGALAALGPIAGKILIDPINPYDFMNNLAPLIAPDQSAAQLLQGKTDAVVVKALNQVGSGVMADAPQRRIKPLQFVAADDAAAKAKVIGLLTDIGFDARDAGGLDYARELEGMARLWIAQAFGHGLAPDIGWSLTGPDA
ncbi:NADPH-dependent F420 reductase [Sphingomonas sp. 28-63-12]|uniref:NADPH-dependent F420 reductase n=1 Tax=Sphingomonas sp. 28-63-12 TaxID=1970434 RepID=UPI0035A96A5C